MGDVMVEILGVGSTQYGKFPHLGFRDLVNTAVQKALADVGENLAHLIEEVHFGNCAMHAWGQPNIRGQVALGDLIKDGTLPGGLPIFNVEAGCATGGMAFVGACRAVASGTASVALAVGVEKLHFPDDPKMLKSFPLFLGGIDQLH